MKTMPRAVLWLMRGAIESMRTIVRCWEDRYADQGDHRMAALSDGLWRAARALRQIQTNDFTIVPPPPRRRPTAGVVPRSMTLADREARELARSAD